MRKFLVLSLSVCFLVFFQLSAKAQLKGFSIGPYVEGALPVGDFGDSFKSGLGAGLGADIKLPLTKFGITASAGYMYFSGKVLAGNVVVPDLHAFPIRAGLKYRFSLLYLKVEAGAANYTKNRGTAFIISPGLGVRILGLDVQAKYESWSKDNNSNGFAGLKVSYNF